VERLFNDAHIPIKIIFPGRSSETIFPKFQLDPGDELLSGQKSFVPDEMKQGKPSSCGHISLDRIFNENFSGFCR
jgi:hypothetical protein